MKIAILTTFNEFHPGYSLTAIVRDQLHMLTKYGHEVLLYVNEQYSDVTYPFELPHGVELRKKTTFAHLIDYQSEKDITPEHEKIANRFALMLAEDLKDVDVCITHDLIFQGWFYPYALGIFKALNDTRRVLFLHWIHSIPSGFKDWWNIQAFRPNHKLVFPNETDRLLVAEQYRGEIEDVRVCPHIVDLRSFFEFHPDTWAFIDHYQIMNKEIIQIYPASSDRLESKRLDWLIHLFSVFKERGHDVCLICANQWAVGSRRTMVRDHEQYDSDTMRRLERFEKIAYRNGLRVGEDFIFTSRYDEPRFLQGIPRQMMRELMMLSNLFVFPTDHESFGLVLPEVALAAAPYPVLNKSLDMMREVGGGQGIYFDMGSFNRQFNPQDGRKYIEDVATIIMGRMVQNESLCMRQFVRRAYNMDTIYQRHLEPIFGEGKLWTRTKLTVAK